VLLFRSLLVLLAWAGVQHVACPAFLDPLLLQGQGQGQAGGEAGGGGRLTGPRILRVSCQAAACVACASSAVPLLTVPATGLLFSRTPCLVHLCVSFLSAWLWVATVLFAQYRFQLSVSCRRNGLWVPGAGGAAGAGAGASAWKAEHVYTKGDVVRRQQGQGQAASGPASGPAPEFQLETYCSISGNSQSSMFTLPSFAMLSLSRSPTQTHHSLGVCWERAVFELLAAEVGPLKASRGADAVLLASAALAAALAAAVYMSKQVPFSL
jgi:hypothetical protein